MNILMMAYDMEWYLKIYLDITNSKVNWVIR